jgi:acetyl-CoA carboxylase carboxyl transferase subunit beta
MKNQFQERKDTFFSFKQLRKKRLLAQTSEGKERFTACKKCGHEFSRSDWKSNVYVCPSCDYHMPISGRARLSLLLDSGTFTQLYPQIRSEDPLSFPGYEDKRENAEEKSGLADAFYGGIGQIERRKVIVGVLDSSYMMGSMGTAVGEKIARFAEKAREEKLPLIIFSASGGARMQEGLFSLMQMAKTAAVIGKFQEEGGLFISVLTHPTTGGVSASFANLGDLILAEPGALIGFAGPRVIRQTIGEELPEGFQRAEFQEEHGFVDRVVPRSELRELFAKILRIHAGGKEDEAAGEKENHSL